MILLSARVAFSCDARLSTASQSSTEPDTSQRIGATVLLRGIVCIAAVAGREADHAKDGSHVATSMTRPSMFVAAWLPSFAWSASRPATEAMHTTPRSRIVAPVLCDVSGSVEDWEAVLSRASHLNATLADKRIITRAYLKQATAQIDRQHLQNCYKAPCSFDLDPPARKVPANSMQSTASELAAAEALSASLHARVRDLEMELSRLQPNGKEAAAAEKHGLVPGFRRAKALPAHKPSPAPKTNNERSGLPKWWAANVMTAFALWSCVVAS